MRRTALIGLALLVMISLAAPLAAAASGTAPSSVQGGKDAVNRALDYLKGRQQSDGGFAEPGKASSEQLTSWAVCAIASAGKDASSWRSSGRSPLDYLAGRVAGTTKLTDLEKDCLAVCSAGLDPRSFGGRNLVEAIKSHIGGDGHIGVLVNEHCWGVIALAAAKEAVPANCRAWLTAHQNIDGGYGYAADSGSDPDDTGAALQALVAAGESASGNAVTRALSYLQFCQASDGGFTWQTQGSNVGSTAWCVQGLAAAGEDAGSSTWTASGKTPLDFLAGMQQGDGHYRYTKSSDANAAWMTAEAIPAVLQKAFPLSAASANTNDPGKTKKNNQTGTTTTSDTQTGSTQGSDQNAGSTSGDPGAPSSTSGSGSKSGKGVASEVGPTYVRAIAVASKREPGGGLAVFLIMCGTYLLALGLVYVCLHAFMPERSTRPYDPGASR